MTGRELIRAICESTECFDAEIPIEILHRDEHNCVTCCQLAGQVVFINGKLKIEASGLSIKPS